MKYFSITIIFALFWVGCSDFVNVKEVNIEERERSLALPILNSELQIVDLGNTINEQTYVEILEDGKLVVHYEGHLNRKKASEVLPEFPIYSPGTYDVVFWPIPDTNYHLSLNLITDLFSEENDIFVKKSTYKNNHLTFDFSSQFDEEIEVAVTMPGMTKEGADFKEVFTIPALGKNIRTDKIPLLDWTLETDNYIPFVYDARKANGERVILDQVLVSMDTYHVGYTEGYFGQNKFAIDADEIEIGVFKKWKSGGFAFENPIIKLEVDNSFGFPVRAKVNYINLTTIQDEVVGLESDFLSKMDFGYPTLEERGKVVTTTFIFDHENSTVKNLFNDKAKRFAYHIEASANPNGDKSIIGFMDENSYFEVKTEVILPLEMKIDELVLVDSFALNLDKQELEVSSARFKLINQNNMPFDIRVQCYFVDKMGSALDSLFGERLFMKGSSLNNQGQLIPADELTTYIDVDKAKYDVLKSATKMVIEVSVDSGLNNEESIWITEENGLLTKLGVILDLDKS